jgi:hypothetical protein
MKYNVLQWHTGDWIASLFALWALSTVCFLIVGTIVEYVQQVKRKQLHPWQRRARRDGHKQRGFDVVLSAGSQDLRPSPCRAHSRHR